MMMKRIVGTVLSFGVILALVAAPANASADATSVDSEDAVPGLAPPGVDKTAVYLDRAGRVMGTAESMTANSNTAQIGCKPESLPDYPHYSSPDVSGHGTWKRGTCTNNRADVFNCLYEYYNDGTWRQKACSPTKRIWAGGGSANRTVARARCNDRAAMISWRNHIDVDVVDEIDTGDNPFKQRDVACRVF
jgi:hypothetical protein